MAKKKKQTKKAAQPVAQSGTLVIPAPLRKRLKLTLKGTTPIIVHNLDDKTTQEMDERYGSQRLAVKKDKVPISPKEAFERALYRMPGKKGRYGVPVSGIKKCALAVCSTIGGGRVIFKSQVMRMFQIINNDGYLCEMKCSKPVLDTQPGRQGPKKVPCLIHRPRFDKWEIPLVIEYDEACISAGSIANLFSRAGFSVGLCDFRPEKGGNFGQFIVQ